MEVPTAASIGFALQVYTTRVFTFAGVWSFICGASHCPKPVLSVEMHTGVERPLLPFHDRQSCGLVVTAAVILIAVVGAWFRNKLDDLLPDPISMTEIVM